MIDYEMEMHLAKLNSELLQVWFCGYHVNIGGGSKDMLTTKKGDFERESPIVPLNTHLTQTRLTTPQKCPPSHSPG